jgi:hypothetical protein
MKRFIPLISFLAFFALLTFSCYYDNEEALYPSLSTSCDTTNVTFNITVVKFLDNNCLSCHSNTTAASMGQNIRLQDYADVKTMAPRISGSIKHNPTFSPMPKNGGLLKSCAINQFDIWVRKGMLNN